MVSFNSEAMPDFIARVTQWPIFDRIKLAPRILQSVDEEASTKLPESPSTDRKRMTVDEVVTFLKMPRPAPVDEECDKIIEEYRM